jgi:hypothetical protein
MIVVAVLDPAIHQNKGILCPSMGGRVPAPPKGFAGLSL